MSKNIRYTVKTLLEVVEKDKPDLKSVGGTYLIADENSCQYFNVEPEKLTFDEWVAKMKEFPADMYVGGTFLFVHEDGHISAMFAVLEEKIAETLGWRLKKNE